VIRDTVAMRFAAVMLSCCFFDAAIFARCLMQHRDQHFFATTHMPRSAARLAMQLFCLPAMSLSPHAMFDADADVAYATMSPPRGAHLFFTR